ncbi:MAG TPA: septal ring lytic transglycosylase RlpA family protein [Terracidiphilus sp.]|nr:septal ring lytic transglycosylase RlpA family protein [Terracidiphilus sp.]
MASLGLALVAIAGCGHHKNVALAPPPNELAPYSPPAYAPAPRTTPLARIPITPVPPGGVSPADLEFVAEHRPILTQVGLATWYRAPYAGRKSANGQVFDDDALTAAHRTLPMGSLVVVTNLKTGQSSPMTITDRGPFVEGRILDLTMAAAKATGVYRAGVADVRLDVYRTPKSINTGGRWCVQIGAFHSERDALKLKKELIHKYADANVIEFPGEKSYWVRIRPEGDNRQMAEFIARNLRPSEGEAYLTRLD